MTSVRLLLLRLTAANWCQNEKNRWFPLYTLYIAGCCCFLSAKFDADRRCKQNGVTADRIVGRFLRHSLRFLQQTHKVERGELHTHTHTPTQRERERERERHTKRRRWCGRWVHCVRRCTRSNGDLYDTPRSAGSTTGVIRQNYRMSGDSTTITVWGKWFIFWSIASIKKTDAVVLWR